MTEPTSAEGRHSLKEFLLLGLGALLLGYGLLLPWSIALYPLRRWHKFEEKTAQHRQHRQCWQELERFFHQYEGLSLGYAGERERQILVRYRLAPWAVVSKEGAPKPLWLREQTLPPPSGPWELIATFGDCWHLWRKTR